MSAYEKELISEHRKHNAPNGEQLTTQEAKHQTAAEHEHFSFKEGSSSNSLDVSSLKKHQDSQRHVIALLNEGLTDDNGENNSEEEKQAEEQFKFKGDTPTRIIDNQSPGGQNDDISDPDDKSERMKAINSTNLTETNKTRHENEGAAPSVHQAFPAPEPFQQGEDAPASEAEKTIS